MLPKSQSGVVNPNCRYMGRVRRILRHLWLIPGPSDLLAMLQPKFVSLIPQYSHLIPVAMYVIVLLEPPIFVLTYSGRLEDLPTVLQSKRPISSYVQLEA
jgi:hypothetical protein